MKCHCAICNVKDREMMQGEDSRKYMMFRGVSAEIIIKFSRPVCQRCADTLIEMASKSLYNVQETLPKE